MEIFDPAFDERFPEARVDLELARAELAQRSSIRATAATYRAIHATLAEARACPEMFVGEALSRASDAQEFAVRGAALELGMRLSMSDQTVRNIAHTTETLLQRAPRVWSLFLEGDISTANARVVADLAATLEREAWQPFEDAVLPDAGLAPAPFKKKARAEREKAEPESMVERHRRAADDRRVWLDRDLDGMSTITVLTEAHKAEFAYARIDKMARHLLSEPGEQRTLQQLRADVAADLLGGALGTDGAPAVTVGVLVPVMTLLGVSEEPATLEGYGPIDAETARKLTAHAPSFYRILTDPIVGTILDADPDSYRIPADLKRLVGLRDQVCRTPGCGRLARDCDIDHTIAWADGGKTRYDNLKVLCRGHHRVKHRTLFTTEQDATGKTTWTSPTGFVRDADPPPF